MPSLIYVSFIFNGQRLQLVAFALKLSAIALRFALRLQHPIRQQRVLIAVDFAGSQPTADDLQHSRLELRSRIGMLDQEKRSLNAV